MPWMRQVLKPSPDCFFFFHGCTFKEQIISKFWCASVSETTKCSAIVFVPQSRLSFIKAPLFDFDINLVLSSTACAFKVADSASISQISNTFPLGSSLFEL